MNALDFNKRFFSKAAGDYDETHENSVPGFYSTLVYIDLVRECLTRSSDIRVKVVGVGTGNNARLLPGVISDSLLRFIDVSPEMLSICGDKVVPGDNKIELHTEDYESKYDLIICEGVLHHMDDPLAEIARQRNQLNPRGVLLLFNEPYNLTESLVCYWLDSILVRLRLAFGLDFVSRILRRKYCTVYDGVTRDLYNGAEACVLDYDGVLRVLDGECVVRAGCGYVNECVYKLSLLLGQRHKTIIYRNKK